MKLEKNSNASPANTNTKPATIKTGITSAEALKPKKVLSKKNNLEDDEKLKKEAGNQQAETSEGNQTTSNSEDAVISNGDKVAAADTTATDATAGAGKSSSTPTAGTAFGINNYALAGLIGLGAIGVAAAASSGGGGGHSNPSGPAADSTSPTLTATNRNSSAQTITLTFSENIDPAHLPASSALTISLNNNPVFSAIPMGSTIAIGAANQLVITLPMGTFTAGDTIAIRYTDPSAANDSKALQDAAGNDVADFTASSFSVIDGYVRNAKIYIDSNGNGIAENNEYTGVVTDENGNFFLSANRPVGGIIATGGVNIDTGVANTIEFKAPGNSSVLTPLTTLIQAYIAANNVDTATAENAIKTAFGIPANIDLLNYDPLAEVPANTDALAVQKIAASIATIITLAAGSDNVLENKVIINLLAAIKDANDSSSTIDLTDSKTLIAVVSNTGTNAQTVSDATTAINNANSFQDISDAQSEALDNISPAAPTLLRLSDSADTGVKGDSTTNISNATIRVSLNISAIDGTASAVDDNITIYNGNYVVGATNLTATDISNGYADIPTQLAPGSNSLTAQITDAAFHKSAFSTATVFVLDTTPPSTPSISLVVDSTDGVAGHNNDKVTNNANLVFSTAATDVTRSYSINGVGSNSYVAPTTDGTYTVLVSDTDTAGNTSSSSITFTLDNSATAPVWTNATGGVLGADGTVSTSDNTPAIGGTAEAGVTINIYNALGSANLPEGALLGTVIAGADGKWSLQLPQLPDGDYRARAEAVDVAGNVSTLAIGPLLRVDTSIATPTITLAVDSTDGANGHDADGISNNANLTFSAPANDVTRTYSINGVANNSYVAPTTDGTYTVLVSDTDTAGNTSSSSITFILDTSATAPVWTNATGGVLVADGTVITNDSTPAIGGTTEAGTTINIYNALGSANLPEGALLGTVIADADGKWSLQLPQLPDGDYRARAEAVDAAGNVSALSVGPLLRLDTTNNPADTTQPYVVSASFTEGANAIITLTYSEPMQIVNTMPPYTWSGINITGASVVNNTVTLTTDKTLTATDVVKLDPYGFTDIGIKDLAGNSPLYRDTIIGGSGDNELIAFYYNSYGIFAGDGADIVRVGDKDDVVTLTETIKSSDIVVINGDTEASTWAFMDNVIDFDVSATTTNDKLDLPSATIAGNTSGFVNGIDVGSIKSHNINNGILTFGSTDTGTTIVLNESNINDAITYLKNNLTAPGLAVGSFIDTDGSGSVDSLIVYQQQGSYTEDVAIMLSGITGATLGNTAGTNVVQIVDSQGPIFDYPVISNNTITFNFNEAIDSYDLTGLSFQHGNGQTLTATTVTGINSNANSITLTTDNTFGTNDYVLITDADKTHQFVTDSNGNMADVFYAYTGFSTAIGGVGNTIIDLSGLTYNDPYIDLTIADVAGGDDTLITGASGFFELNGGIGNDTLDARLSSNANLFGGDGNDVLYGAQYSNEFAGGKGADKITGSTDGQGQSFFMFWQGDSTSVTFADQGNNGLSNGDLFTFDGSADIILGGLKASTRTSDPLGQTHFYGGDAVEFYNNFDSNLSEMNNPPLNGLVTDQSFFFQQGSYLESNGIFTVSSTGTDALIVYDGDETTAVTQTALVIANVNSTYLTSDSWGSVFLEQPPVI